MPVRIFIDGAHGTTGLDIRERLGARGDVALVILSDADRRLPAARHAALRDAEIAILCLPDDAAREAVAMAEGSAVRIIDASSAHRTAPGWTYGFAELRGGQRAAIASARLVSNPGCYPTGFLALVAPLVAAGLVPADHPVNVNAVSGYTGGGKTMIADYESGAVTSAHSAYALSLAHKHLGEMQRHAALAHPPIFSPAVTATARGMVIEVPLALHALPAAPGPDRLFAALADHYAGERLVEVIRHDPADPVRVEELAGRDTLRLRVCGNAATGQARLIATLDNLGKGAGGAAVQNVNIMAGLDEHAGLVL